MVLDSVHQQSGGIPVAKQRQVCTVLVVQMTWRFTVAVLGPRCCARFVERQVWVQTVQNTVELPQVQLLWCCGVAVVIQRLFQQSKSYGSRAIQFPRQSAGHSSYATAVFEPGC